MAVNKGTAILLAGAIGSGGGAAYLTDDYISNRVKDEQQRLSSQYKPTKVVVAKENLRVGDMLSYDNLAIREMPAGYIHSSAVRSENADFVVGKRIMQPINAGESLLENFLASRTNSSFANLIEKGNRAITFPVDIISSMSGMLRPGDKIDLMVTLRQGKNVTMPLLKNVTILATGAIVDEEGMLADDGSYQTITISETPLNAARITHARQVGNMTVVLRSGKEDETGKESVELTQPVTVQNLFGKTKKTIRKAPSVEIIVGG
jgi:pilus assembly protein CpaB